jgi:seryl-tRNA synthetase
LSSVELDKKEWEVFLEKLSELEEKYMSVLRELDEARSQLHALEKAPKTEETNTLKQATVATVDEVTAPEQAPKTAQLNALQRLRNKLQSLQAIPTTRISQGPSTPYRDQNASCSRCGYRINYSTRFCAHCGADFGGWICACGRTLSG